MDSREWILPARFPMTKPFMAWVIVSYHKGKPYVIEGSIRSKKKEAIAYIIGYGQSWKQLYRKGCRVERVRCE